MNETQYRADSPNGFHEHLTYDPSMTPEETRAMRLKQLDDWAAEAAVVAKQSEHTHGVGDPSALTQKRS